MNCSDSQILRNKSLSFLTNMTALSAVMHINATSRKNLEIQAWSLTKPRTHSEWKFVWILVFSCSYTSWKLNLRRNENYLVWILVVSGSNLFTYHLLLRQEIWLAVYCRSDLIGVTYIHSHSLTHWSIDPSIKYSTRRLRRIFFYKKNNSTSIEDPASFSDVPRSAGAM